MLKISFKTQQIVMLVSFNREISIGMNINKSIQMIPLTNKSAKDNTIKTPIKQYFTKLGTIKTIDTLMSSKSKIYPNPRQTLTNPANYIIFPMQA